MMAILKHLFLFIFLLFKFASCQDVTTPITAAISDDLPKSTQKLPTPTTTVANGLISNNPSETNAVVTTATTPRYGYLTSKFIESPLTQQVQQQSTVFDYGDYAYESDINDDVIDDDIARRIAKNPALNSSIDAILVILVLQTMLGLGCTMDIAAIRDHLKNPIGIFVAAVCQFGIMPLIAFILALACGLDKIAAIAVLVTGACPGGNLSNLITYFSYGDLNLSVLMSTVSTLLSIILMPLCLFIYGTTWISTAEIGRMIPFGGILLSLLLTLLPVVGGIAIRRWSEKIANIVLKISLLTFAVSVIAIMTLSGMLFGVKLFTALPASMYAIAIFMPLVGGALGYLLAMGFGLPDASKRTVGIETGCQNSQLSSAILKLAFSGPVMGSYFLFPVYYAIFQGLEGLGFIMAFRIYRRYHADEELAPISRVTYDKFDDDDWEADVGDREYGVGDYSRISGSTVEGRHHINGNGSGYQGSGISVGNTNGNAVSKQPVVPSELPITNAYSPKEPEHDMNILTPDGEDDTYNLVGSGRLQY